MANKPQPNIFDEEVKAFNQMYLMPALTAPGIPFVGTSEKTARQQFAERLADFKDILREELDEVDEIIRKIEAGDAPDEILTELADWLGDIQVYCASEMRKFGMDNSVVLSLIMASNRSKLGKDGKPIYDARGKVMKGPDYWRPEPMIRKYILAATRQAERSQPKA